MASKLVACWESYTGRWYVRLYQTDTGFKYEAVGASGYLEENNLADAIANIEARVNDFQPDSNTRPMTRISISQK